MLALKIYYRHNKNPDLSQGHNVIYEQPLEFIGYLWVPNSKFVVVILDIEVYKGMFGTNFLKLVFQVHKRYFDK